MMCKFLPYIAKGMCGMYLSISAYQSYIFIAHKMHAIIVNLRCQTCVCVCADILPTSHYAEFARQADLSPNLLWPIIGLQAMRAAECFLNFVIGQFSWSIERCVVPLQVSSTADPGQAKKAALIMISNGEGKDRGRQCTSQGTMLHVTEQITG